MSAVTDPIADMLTRIRNAIRARHPRVEMPASKLKAEIARLLRDEGYLSSYKVTEEGKKKVLRLVLKYDNRGQNVITRLDRVSRPGRRVYAGAHEIPKVLGGLGVNIITTPQGLMTGKAARQAGLGGEILCTIE